MKLAPIEAGDLSAASSPNKVGAEHVSAATAGTEKLRGRTMSGIKWTVVAQVINQCFAFGISMLLARILGPKSYGLVGMVTVCTNFVALFSELGFGLTLIQRKNISEAHLNTAFWSTCLMGVLLASIMTALAPGVAAFYHEPLLRSLSSALGLRFLLSGLGVVQIVLLTKNMHFRQIAMIEIGGVVVGGLCGLGLALRGGGAWSLVVQSLASAGASTTSAWVLSRWRPAFSFRFSAWKELFGVSSYILGFSFVNYWARNLDSLLIGRVLGPLSLGFYSRAYSLMLLPLNQVTQVLGKVMFPALSLIQEDKDRVKAAYLNATSVIALITFPMMVGLFVVSEQFILSLLGPKWAGAIPLLKLFCVVGLLQSITSTLGWLTTSQGKMKMYFWVGVMNASAYVFSFLVGLRWGAEGVALCYAICNVITVYPLVRICAGIVGLSFSRMAGRLGGTLACSLAMGLGVVCVQRVIPPQWPTGVSLAVSVSVGIVVYLALLEVFKLRSWALAKEVVGQALGDKLPFLQNYLKGVPAE